MAWEGAGAQSPAPDPIPNSTAWFRFTLEAFVGVLRRAFVIQVCFLAVGLDILML